MSFVLDIRRAATGLGALLIAGFGFSGAAVARSTVLPVAAPAAVVSAQMVVCDRPVGVFSDAASANGITLYAMEWSPFGSRETGWEAYVPLIQHEIGAACDPTSQAFAEQLAGFQQRYNLAATGQFDAATFAVFRGLWQERRPFVMARVRGECPAPPPLSELGYLTLEEEHAERLTRLVRKDVLEAYRAMVEAARQEVPEIAANPELMRIFSSFRDPEADAARCARERNCDGVRRAVCSPHRTGTALDIYVGNLQGYGVDSTNWHSRRYMSETPAYRWMVKNAHRFGFVPYVFEPWHWEWTGVSFDAPSPSAP